jgi:hypothetical protein
MALPVYRFGSIELDCPCCGALFETSDEPITCPECEAKIELCADERAAQERIAEYGGEKHKGPQNLWLVAFSKGSA